MITLAIIMLYYHASLVIATTSTTNYSTKQKTEHIFTCCELLWIWLFGSLICLLQKSFTSFSFPFTFKLNIILFITFTTIVILISINLWEPLKGCLVEYNNISYFFNMKICSLCLFFYNFFLSNFMVIIFPMYKPFFFFLIKTSFQQNNSDYNILDSILHKSKFFSYPKEHKKRYETILLIQCFEFKFWRATTLNSTQKKQKKLSISK